MKLSQYLTFLLYNRFKIKLGDIIKSQYNDEVSIATILLNSVVSLLFIVIHFCCC